MYLYIWCCEKKFSGTGFFSHVHLYPEERENVSQKANKNVTFYLLLPL